MTRQEALARLKPSLIDAIEAWWNEQSEQNAATGECGYLGDGTFNAMASAALSVLDGIGDCQQYFDRCGAIDYSKL